ncbi:hypothetical protein, partial [Sphingomonas bacterium]|uniref:hypothetical protein n=1 Tax=Sphingomonas bacterium TaxID=1895847 RepID=UPI001C2D0F99
MTRLRHHAARRRVPALAASGVFGLLAALWIAGAFRAYRQIVILWGVDVFDFPFLDTETMLSGARCLRAGIDIYVSNPCDTLGRIYDYSPLWMLVAHLPVTLAWGAPAGLIVALAYIGSLLLLPEARTARHTVAIALGAVSSVAVFAVERGNNDLLLFLLAGAAATLACRSPRARLLGYGLALLAGLLKYFPLALLALAAREPPRRAAAIAAVAILLTLLFAASAWHDLVRALGLI